MELAYLLSFLGASVLLTLMPGPDNIFVLTQSITRGPKHGLALTIGLVSGVLIHTMAASTGLSIILLKSALAFRIIKYLGAAYLLYLAYLATREQPITLDLGTSEQEDFHFFKHFRKGFIMNVLNPKVSLFFIAFLPQFITPNAMRATLQMVIMGIVFMIQAWIIFSLIAVLSGKLAGYLNRPRFWSTTKWIKAVILAVLGISVALTKNT